VKILHAYWSQTAIKKIHIWIENDNPFFKNKNSQYLQSSKNVEVHPSAAGAVILPELLAPCFSSFKNKSESSKLKLYLPIGEKETILSSVFFDHSENIQSPLRQWEIPTVGIDFQNANECLKENKNIDKFFKRSPEFIFLQELLEVAVKTLKTGLVSPRLVKDDTVKPTCFTSVWNVDPSHMESCLEKIIPYFPLSFQYGSGKEILPEKWIADFLNSAVNQLIRQKTKSVFSWENIEDKDSENWLKSLTDAHGLFEGEEFTCDLLLKTLDESHELPQQKEPYRLLLKLEEPALGEDLWIVKFLLQNRYRQDDTVWINDLWAKKPTSQVSLKNFTGYEVFFLKELTKLEKIYNKVSKCLSQNKPSFFTLTNQEAYHFLCEDALRLKAQGFKAIVPEWWVGKKTRASVILKIKPLTEELKSLGVETLLDYEWKVKFGDEILNLKEFEKIIRRRAPLVRQGNQWIELRIREIENAILYFDEHLQKNRSPMAISQALKVSLQGELCELGLPVSKIEAEGWVQSFVNFLFTNENLDLIDLPQTFKGILRPYQHRGISWLNFLQKRGFGTCLADDMGLGKTVQLIAFLLHERRETARVKPEGADLLICPMSIVSNWEHELKKFSPTLNVWTHHGTKRLSGTLFQKKIKGNDLVITTYQLVLKDQALFKKQTWNRVILDEAQNIKNEMAQQTLAVKLLKSKFRIALTGTPVENRLSELWSIMDFLNPGYLGTIQTFKKKYQNPIERGTGQKRLEALNSLTRPFILRRLKTDEKIIQDLPDKIETKEFCMLSLVQKKLYRETMNEMMNGVAEASGIQRRGLVLAMLTKLKQICNHPAQFLKASDAVIEESGKTLRMLELLREFEECGEKVLIFTQYVEMGKLLEDIVINEIGCPVFFLHGALSKVQREKQILDFQNAKKNTAVFILSTKAGGVGLNLTAANHVIHYDRWWNPAVENQATDRAFRIGQKKRVLVYKFICAKTFEERIDQMIDQKLILQEKAISTGESFLTEISNEELREILRLKEDE
jgi:SNF2 family DNA or RNA helicase